MTEIFLRPELYPFSIALAVVFGLFLLEIISLILGGSLMAIGSDAPDLDIDLDADFDIDIDVDTDLDLVDMASAPVGVLDWVGLKEVPFLIWFVSFLTLFALTGLILQSMLFSIFTWLLPAIFAALISFLPALRGAKFMSSTIATLMPKHESSAMSKRFLGGHHGTITQGTAKRGSPAEAKIKDRHGNTHYLRVEPLDDKDEIAQGRAVHVIRKRSGMFYVVDIT